jgi:hypothetical protein
MNPIPSRPSPAPSGGSSRSSPARNTSNANPSQTKHKSQSQEGWDTEDSGWGGDSWSDTTVSNKQVIVNCVFI